MVSAALRQLSVRVDITGGIGKSFHGSLREARRDIITLQNATIKLQGDLNAARARANSFGQTINSASIQAGREVVKLEKELKDVQVALAQVTNQAEGMERLQRAFRGMTGAVVGLTAGFAGIGLLTHRRVLQTQELIESQLEAGIRSAESIQRARRAAIGIGLNPYIGDEIVKEIGKEGKKKAAEAVVDPGSEQAKRIRQFVTDRSAADLLEQANTDPEGYALFVLETLQRVNREAGAAQASLLAEVLAGETGGDAAAGLINAGWFDEFVNGYTDAIRLNDQQVDGVRQLSGALTNLNYAFGQFIDALGAALAPILTPFLNWLTKGIDLAVKFLAEHRTLATVLAVTLAGGFFAVSAAMGVASAAFLQLWVSSLFATGGVTSSGIAAAIASGSWWSLAGAIWAATWPIIAVIAVVAGLVVGFYFLQKAVGGVGEAFKRIGGGLVLVFFPVTAMLWKIMWLITGIIKLINLIPGVNIGTGALDAVRGAINPYSKLRPSFWSRGDEDDQSNTASNRVQPQKSPTGASETDSGTGGLLGQIGGSLTPAFGSAGVPAGLPRPSTATNQPVNEDNSVRENYVFNTENNFYGPTSDAPSTVAEDIEKQLSESVSARRFRR